MARNENKFGTPNGLLPYWYQPAGFFKSICTAKAVLYKLTVLAATSVLYGERPDELFSTCFINTPNKVHVSVQYVQLLLFFCKTFSLNR